MTCNLYFFPHVFEQLDGFLKPIPSKVYLIRHKLLLPLQKISKKREIHGY